jgi:alkanesulfonate monooxygenase SsuD/methylene tetrahydromethanopterin reductase-like flavin-dependent oxidoreductase (luciferase family)
LTRRIAELEAKLGGPPKTPDNSSVPPSQRRKPNRAERRAAKKRTGRPGVFRALAPHPDREERFDEGLEVILKAWTSEGRFSHHGKFWNFQNIVVEPAAAQAPRPAIWMAAGSELSIYKVARRGFNLLLDQFAGPDLIKQRLCKRVSRRSTGR